MNVKLLVLTLIGADTGFTFPPGNMLDPQEDEAFPPLPPPHSPGQGGQDERNLFADGEKLLSKSTRQVFEASL